MSSNQVGINKLIIKYKINKMITFKHNDKVTCKIEGVEIKDAKISINESGSPFICQNIKNGSDAKDKLGYRYSWILNSDFTDMSVTDLKLAEKTWDNLEEGDVLVSKFSQELIVIGICGKAIFLGSKECATDVIIGMAQIYTKEELINRGYTIKIETPTPDVEEMTVEQVCKLLGKEIKIIK